jgi:surfactin synthase thioesterase subunit
MKAILLHHAGGDKYAYKNMQQWLLPEIPSIAFEIPGRSDRFSEPLLNDIHDITDDIFHQIKNEINEDYFFIGVSMGALLAYLLSHRIAQNNLPLPKYLFLASRLSPDAYKESSTKIPQLSSDEFWNVVIQYNGVPDALIQHHELRELYEPILRADFEALEKYNISHQNKIALPISSTILFGKDDTRNITHQTAQGWSNHFNAETSFAEFDGGHFFVYENVEVAKHIKSVVANGK